MAKRGADKDLNHDNWDQEDDEEEAGVFRHASKEVIGTREIKKAKRRLQNESGNAGSETSALKGFSFGAVNSSSAPFSFATQINTSLSDSSKAALSNFKFTSSAVTPAAIATTASSLASLSCSPVKSTSGATAKEPDSEYRNSLRNLNESVVRWISDHVKKNPYCILSPVFSDYDNYIKQLESEYSAGGGTSKTAGFSFGSSSVAPVSMAAPAPSSGSFSFGVKSTESTPMDVAATMSATTSVAKGFSSSAATAVVSASGFGSTMSASIPSFSFGIKSSKEAASVTAVGSNSGQPAAETSAASASGFTFNSKPSGEAPSTSKPSFSFGTSALSSASAPAAGGFMFGTSLASTGASTSLASTSANESDATQGTSQSGDGGDDANYVPPKAEVVDIQEDDAFYTVRCKLYFKVDNEFKDRGVGNLYLKPCGEKTQLLVRAGTALGNILLNIMLNKSIPTSRQGNRVTMVCIPNPPLSEKGVDKKAPICMVLRVKTEDEAEALLKQINDHKA